MRDFSFRTDGSSVSLVDVRDDGSYLDLGEPATRVVAYVAVATDKHSDFTELTVPALREMSDWCNALLAEIDQPGTDFEMFIAPGGTLSTRRREQ